MRRHYAGSDHLKQNINDFSSAMEIINQLHPKYYEYRHDSHYQLMNLPKGEHYDLIAQDVEKILPGLVKIQNSKRVMQSQILLTQKIRKQFISKRSTTQSLSQS